MKVKLFLLSFLILFLELTLIRWIPANVRLVGFFSNLILIGSFFGIGVGFLLARSKIRLLWTFPILLLVTTIIVMLYRFNVNVASNDVLFFIPIFDRTNTGDPPAIILPLIFFLSAGILIPLAQEAGTLFRQFRPIDAYTIDILGSIAGIILFTLLSVLSTAGSSWFTVITIIGLVLLYRRHVLSYIAMGVLILVPLVIKLHAQSSAIWSPYYKIHVTPIDDPRVPQTVFDVNVNNIGHQYISHYKYRESFYFAPYKLMNPSSYKRILVIGAGTGADVATALAMAPNVEHIDAVEIDPKLIEIGRKLNPDKPYDDPRVRVIVNDGRRNFLNDETARYDLIIYGLTDSLTLTANTNNIRLESFLFTKESFAEARQHLRPGGLLMLYNYYREQWLVDKIAIMLTQVFGEAPYVRFFEEHGTAAVFFAGPKTKEIPIAIMPYQPKETLKPATDDWPFLYLKRASIPPMFLTFIGILVALCILSIGFVLRRSQYIRINWHFFFLGAGFLLLETKNLVNFALLFGNTWLVNALVFLAVLISILVANLLTIRQSTKHIWIFYVLLLATLILNFVTPPSVFLGLYPVAVRYVVVSIFYFSPVFIANLIFSHVFKDTKDQDINFGSNLLGAVVGGFVEYLSLVVGYRMLIPILGVFYLLAFGAPHGTKIKQ